MKLNLDNIKDKESGKVGLVIALGPSLREVLHVVEDMSKNNRDKVAFYSCNLFSSMMNVTTDYWLVTNQQETMRIANAHSRYNGQESVFIFTPRLDGFSMEDAEKHLSVDYLPIWDQPGNELSLADYLQKYTEAEAPYPPVESVVIHQIATAIITGCKEVYISGVDLDYKGGYVKKGAHESGVALGKQCMDARARERTINNVRFLKSCAKNVGCELYTLNETGPLSQVLEFKDISNLKKKLDETQ